MVMEPVMVEVLDARHTHLQLSDRPKLLHAVNCVGHIKLWLVVEMVMHGTLSGLSLTAQLQNRARNESHSPTAADLAQSLVCPVRPERGVNSTLQSEGLLHRGMNFTGRRSRRHYIEYKALMHTSYGVQAGPQKCNEEQRKYNQQYPPGAPAAVRRHDVFGFDLGNGSNQHHAERQARSGTEPD